MNNEIFARSIGLLGEENFELVQNKVIAVFGLGGVGGTALEALARTGFQHFIIVDFDTVDVSNLNRQILYTFHDVGLKKVDVAKEKLLAINPVVDIKKYFIKAQDYVFDERIDFIVDAIDDVNSKVWLSQKAKELNIPSIMSLGMANRYEPDKVHVASLNQTHSDPLAKKMRHLIKSSGLDPKEIVVVISEELPQKNGEKLFSTMMVPSSAGLTIANYILKSIIIERWKKI